MTEQINREYFSKKGLEGAKKLQNKYGNEHYKKMARARWDKEKNKKKTDKE